MTPIQRSQIVADRVLIADQHQVEFRSKSEAACVPLAEGCSIFLSKVFSSAVPLSRSKRPKPRLGNDCAQLREYIREWSWKTKRRWTRRPSSSFKTNSNNQRSCTRGGTCPGVEFIAEEDIVPSEHDEEIKRLLDEFVRPVEQDGGAIDFKAYKGQGLRTCAAHAADAVEYDAQGGIEQLLTSKIDAITEVVALGLRRP